MADRGSGAQEGRRPRWAAALVGLLLSGLLLAACSSPRASAQQGEDAEAAPDAATEVGPSSEPTIVDEATAQVWTSPAAQTSEAGQVTVVVTWREPGGDLVFQVAMDTHSVDLDRYDLGQLALLRTDEGTEALPSGWDAPRGGHHRSGTLAFPATLADGSPLVGPNTRQVELVIRSVAGVAERVFPWTR